MALQLRTTADWARWLSELDFPEETVNKYAKQFFDADITEVVLRELNHEILRELAIDKPGHRMQILQKTKTELVELSTKMIKSDIKLPHIKMKSSPSQFRKFIIDWNIYKSETQISGAKCNRLLYSACGELLQNNIINAVPEFLELSEDSLIEYIKNMATKSSHPAVYRLAFYNLHQKENQSIDQYVDELRSKAVDCNFVCPSDSCTFDYSDYAIMDRLIQGVYEKTTQTNILTHIQSLQTLEDVIKHTNSIEAAKQDISLMEEVNKKHEYDDMYVARASTYKRGNQQNKNPNFKQNTDELCTGCGRPGHSSYLARKANCPAWGKIAINAGSEITLQMYAKEKWKKINKKIMHWH